MAKLQKKSFASIGGIVTGAISVLGSFAVFATDKGSYVSNKSYGGDAYTGMQNASAGAANNVIDVANICATGLGLILLVIGLAIICYFLRQLLADMSEAEAAAPTASNSATPTPVVSETPAVVPVETPAEIAVEAAPATETWDCSCGHTRNTGAFCVACGKVNTQFSPVQPYETSKD